MSAEYTVRSVEGERRWTGMYGEMIDYSITITDDDGPATQRVTTTRKPESPIPFVGEVIYGHLETEEIEKKDGSGTFTKTKLKRDQRPETSGAGHQDNAGRARAGAEGGGAARASALPSAPGDDRSRRIERQHSQEMAIRTVDLRMRLLLESVDKAPLGDPTPSLRTQIKDWTDWFAADLELPTHSAPSKAPSSPGNGGAVGDAAPPAPSTEEVNALGLSYDDDRY